MKIKKISLLFLIVVLIGCSRSTTPESNPEPSETILIKEIGTIEQQEKTEIWLINADNGITYFPKKTLSKEFKELNLRVKFEAEELETITNPDSKEIIGYYIKITKIERLSDLEIIHTTGILQYINIEGGFLGIIGDNDVNYEPLNIEKFKNSVNQGAIYFTAVSIEETETSSSWGKPIELLSIENIEDFYTTTFKTKTPTKPLKQEIFKNETEVEIISDKKDDNKSMSGWRG